MAKKGVTYPWRIRYHYPASDRSGGKEINGSVPLMSRETMVSQARDFLKRGADITLGSRRDDGKIDWFFSAKPEDLPVELLEA